MRIALDWYWRCSSRPWGSYGVFRDYQKAAAQFALERNEIAARLRDFRQHHPNALQLEDRFIGIAGRRANRCALAQRRATSGDQQAIESWLMEPGENGKIQCVMAAPITDMWIAPNKRIYFVASGQLYVLLEHAHGVPTRVVELDGELTGVWGLTDNFLLAWGTVMRGGSRNNIIYRSDGIDWTEIASPSIEAPSDAQQRTINVIRASAPDNLLAAGEFGLLSHYDGETWCDADVPSDAHFTGVHVESSDEMYAACGVTLYKGSRSGWAAAWEGREAVPGDPHVRASTSAAIDVAKFEDRIWVASAETGLHTLEGRELVPLREKRPAHRLEIAQNRKALLYVSDDAVGSTADGKDFQQWPISALVDRIEGRARVAVL